MKIAIFSGTIPSTTFVEHLIEGVAEHHEVLLFGVQNKPKNYLSKHIKIHATPGSILKNSSVSLFRSLKLLFTNPQDLILLIKEVLAQKSSYERWTKFTKCLPIVLYKPDILHVQWAKDIEHYAFLKIKFGIPLVLSLRGAHINYTPIIEPRFVEIYRSLFPFVDKFHAVSEAIAKEASKYDDIANRTQVIHSPIPVFFLEAYKPKNTSKNDVIKLVSVGRFHWKKGYKHAIDAVAQLKAKGYHVHYTIVGVSEPTEAIAFQMHQLGVTDSVSFKGNLEQNQLIPFLQSQDVLVLPSVEEGIANVVLEAMTIGLPVISTDCGGMAEVIIPNETGWLVAMRDAEAIVKAVIDIQNTNETSLNTIQKNAHHLIQEQFSYKDSIAAFVSMYESLVD